MSLGLYRFGDHCVAEDFVHLLVLICVVIPLVLS